MIRLSRGFTLVEVLIGLALMGFILAMIYSGLYTTSRSWKAGISQADTNDDFRLTSSFIRREISETVPISRKDGKDNHVIFEGEKDSLRLVSALPPHVGGGGLYLVVFQQSESNGHSALEFTYGPLDSENVQLDEPGTPVKKQILIDPVSVLTFFYFGREKDDDEPRWYDTWKDRDRLPELVRIHISSEQDSWPELTIRLAAEPVPGRPELMLSGTTGGTEG